MYHPPTQKRNTVNGIHMRTVPAENIGMILDDTYHCQWHNGDDCNPNEQQNILGKLLLPTICLACSSLED
jgi:hypothetical protein